ncbi:MAG TPA: BON domain-containing protein [Polyangiaceae bacterium]
MQNDQRGSSGYAGRDSERPEGEQDDRDAWGEYPGQFGGEYDDAERRFGPRSSAQRDYAAGYPAPPRRAYAGPNRRRSFRGRGPRGYTRSDERIREDVCDRLTEEDVDVSDVEVRVTKGEVALSGSVPDRATKREVEDIAERVSGVTDVANELRVRRPEAGGEAEKPLGDRERPKSE